MNKPLAISLTGQNYLDIFSCNIADFPVTPNTIPRSKIYMPFNVNMIFIYLADARATSIGNACYWQETLRMVPLWKPTLHSCWAQHPWQFWSLPTWRYSSPWSWWDHLCHCWHRYKPLVCKLSSGWKAWFTPPKDGTEVNLQSGSDRGILEIKTWEIQPVMFHSCKSLELHFRLRYLIFSFIILIHFHCCSMALGVEPTHGQVSIFVFHILC